MVAWTREVVVLAAQISDAKYILLTSWMERESDYGFPAWATGQVVMLLSDIQIMWEQVLGEKLDFALGRQVWDA